ACAGVDIRCRIFCFKPSHLFGNSLSRYDLWNIVDGFLGKEALLDEFAIIARIALSNRTNDSVLASIVGTKGQFPASENIVEIAKIASGCRCGLVDILSLIHTLVDAQAIAM